MNELTLLTRSSHPNIIQCFGHFWDRRRKSLFLVLEFATGGNLYDYLQKQKTNFPLSWILEMNIQLAKSMSHLHQHGIVHRDIKSSNILLVAPIIVRRSRSPQHRKPRLGFELKDNDNEKCKETTFPWILKMSDLGASRSVSPSTLLLHTAIGR